MKDENEDQLSRFRRRTSNLFRRRVYVAAVMGLTIMLVGVAVWPLTAKRFSTTAQLRVRISPGTTGTAAASISADPSSSSEVAIDAEYFLQALQDSVQESISDESLASCIRRAVMFNRSGMAPMTTDQLRESLEVRVSRSMADPTIREIKVSRLSDGQAMDQRIVNLIVQELSSRLSRKANYRALQSEVEKQVNQVAMKNRRWASELLTMVLEVQASCQHYDQQLDQLAIQLKEAGQSQQSASGQLQQQIEQIQQQVLTSDLQLLRSIRQQMKAHYQVDETDPLVQHVERLISEREVVLSQFHQQVLEPSMQAGPEKVRTNPFMMASYGKQTSSTSSNGLQASQALLAQVRLDQAYGMLDQLRLSLQNPVVGQIPVVPFAGRIESQPAHFLITEMQPAALAVPLDGVPSDRWLLGMGLVAGLVGVAFSLQWQPQALGRQIFSGKQLADWLGLEHLGAVDGRNQNPGWLERKLTGGANLLFRVAEMALLLALCAVIVAMIWDNQLPGLIADQPVTGFCRAIWVLFGRG